MACPRSFARCTPPKDGKPLRRVLVVERFGEIYRLPRAVHLDHEIMRLLQALGVADALAQEMVPVSRYHWFGADFIPEGWKHSERFTDLWTELLPVLFFIVIGVFFWWRGKQTRELAARVAADVPPPAA